MKKILIASVIALASAGAFAQKAMYAGGNYGITKISTECGSGSGCDTKDTGYKAFFGYKFTPNIAIEGTYYDFGKASESGAGSVVLSTGDLIDVTYDISYKGSGFGIGGAYHIPFGAGFSGVARLGVASMKGKVSATVTAPSLGVSDSASESKTKTGLIAGLGFGYNITPALKVNLDLDVGSVKFSSTTDSVRMISAGLSYDF